MDQITIRELTQFCTDIYAIAKKCKPSVWTVAFKIIRDGKVYVGTRQSVNMSIKLVPIFYDPDTNKVCSSDLKDCLDNNIGLTNHMCSIVKQKHPRMRWFQICYNDKKKMINVCKASGSMAKSKIFDTINVK